MVSMFRGLEQQFDIAAQMIDAGRGDLLHYGAGETAELRDFPLEKPLAEVEIAEDSILGDHGSCATFAKLRFSDASA
jgi:hypothetical protein